MVQILVLFRVNVDTYLKYSTMYSNKDDTPSSTGLPHRINTPSLGPKTMLGSSKAHSPSGREPLMTSPIASSQSSNGESGEGNYNQLWATGDPPQQRLEGVFKSREEVTDDFQSMFYGDPTLYSNIARAGSGSKEGSTLRKNRQPEDGYEGKGGTTDFLRQASNSSDSNFESNSSYAEQVKRTALSASNEGGSPVRKENQHQADAGSRHPQQGPPPRRKVLRYTAPQLLEAFEELDPPENLPDVPAITTQECLPPASFTPFDPLEVRIPLLNIVIFKYTWAASLNDMHGVMTVSEALAKGITNWSACPAACQA